MNILKNIAYKNLQLNKKRNIVTVIGIILSVALITALSSLVVSFKESIINLEKHINGDFHYSFDGVQSNDLSIFENNRSIENFYKVGTLGYAKINTENEYKPYAYVITMDKNDFNSVGIELTDGELPKNNNEIIIPRHLRNNGKVDLKVGDTITLEVGSRMSEGYALGQNNPYEETNNETIENTVSVTYKVVGIFERPSTALEPFSSPGYTFITTNASGVKNYTVFARYTREGLKNEYKVTAGILGVNEKVLKKNIQEFNYKEVNEKEQGKSKFYFDINRYLIMLETNAYGDSSMKALLVLSTIVTVIIIVTSVYCIKNSFNISITEKTKEYGILKSVGATTSQIKKSVYYEAFLLGCVGIPIGILSGVLASFILIHVVNFFIRSMFVGNEYLIFKISYLSIVISIILSIITIFMSSKKGAKIASKTSPMVLIRGNDDIKVNSKKLKTPKYINKLFGIGGVVSYKNIKRNKKKYRTTIVSIVMSVSVYIALSYFVNTAFDVVKMAKGSYTYNLVYTSYTKDYNLNYNNVLNFSKHDTVKKYSVVRTSIITGNFKASKDFKKYNAYMSEEKPILNSVTFISVGKEEYLRYISKLGLNYNSVKDKGILIDNNIGYDTKKKLEVSYNMTDNKKGDIINFTSMKEDKTFDMELASVTNIRPFGYENNYGSLVMVISDEYMERLDKLESVSLYVESTDPDKLQSDIDKMCKDTEGCYVNNVDATVKQMKSIYTVIAIFLYGFIIVISLIGITNIFNTITTNMTLRKREFATLKSIGMTSNEFNRMIFLESFFYIFKSLLIGIPIGVLLSYLIFKGFTNQVLFSYKVPFKGIIVSIAIVCLLIVWLNNYSSKKANKGNVIETIRNENI
jgi:putative ABC transport system permease protein